jgi:HEAT repeat protein
MWELALAYPFLVGGLVAWGTVLHNRRRLKRWRDTLAFCGFLQVERTGKKRMDITARAGGVEVRIRNSHRGDAGTRVVVAVPGPPGFSEVRIRRALKNPLPWVREIEVGDPPFDAELYLGGPPELLCALLDADTRGLLANLNRGCYLEIIGGEIRADILNVQVDILLPLLLDLCRRFSNPVDVPVRLARNVRSDPESGARLQSLLLLSREFAGHPETIQALRAARSDANPEIQLRAAIALGAEGRDFLEQLAAGLEDDARSALAVSALASELPSERTRDILAHALRRRRLQTARVCLGALGARGPSEVEVLAKVMAVERGELAAAAALALGTTGSAAAEPSLIQALERDQEDLQLAAVKALAEVGTSLAVLPLKGAAERFARDQDLRRAIRQAIAAIHSRLAGASPGQLSLADHEAGQLSLAQADTGQLALANDGDGQLSLPSEELGQLSNTEVEKGSG